MPSKLAEQQTGRCCQGKRSRHHWSRLIGRKKTLWYAAIILDEGAQWPRVGSKAESLGRFDRKSSEARLNDADGGVDRKLIHRKLAGASSLSCKAGPRQQLLSKGEKVNKTLPESGSISSRLSVFFLSPNTASCSQKQSLLFLGW